MITIGIDPGTACGWAMLDGAGKRLGSGVWDLRVLRGEGNGMRFIRLRSHLTELIRTAKELGGDVLVTYELVTRHRSGHVGHVYGGIQSHLMTVCEDHGTAYSPVPWEDLKLRATGRRGAKKPEMIAAANAHWGLDLGSDDEADALWCALVGHERWGV